MHVGTWIPLCFLDQRTTQTDTRAGKNPHLDAGRRYLVCHQEQLGGAGGHFDHCRISGLGSGEAVSRGQVSISTSRDPVGRRSFIGCALMPSETEKGVIKPLATKSVR